jgi:hypothetical protein
MPLFVLLSGANFEQVFSTPLSQGKQHDIIGVSLSASAPRGRTRDEGRSLGAGLQERAPNHLKLRW